MLSILICTIPKRKAKFDALLSELNRQNDFGAEIIFNADEKMTIGEKRNWLLEKATQDYVCFIDDDDMISRNYLAKIYEKLTDKPDCLSLMGVLTCDGEKPELFEHSISYSAYKTNPEGQIKYERYPNHLNVIKSSIAKQFKFPVINFGEDTEWATQIFNSGLLKRESVIKEVIYHYRYESNKL